MSIFIKALHIALFIIFMAKPGTIYGESFPNEQTILFTNLHDEKKLVASLQNPNILTVVFAFNPYAKNAMDAYLPDGYITVNGEYNVTELIIKHFFYPLLEYNELNILMLDLNPFLQKDSINKLVKVKELFEKLQLYIKKNQLPVILGLKFKYEKEFQTAIQQLFSYTIIAENVRALQIESGYESFFENHLYQSTLKNVRYLNLSHNTIGNDSTHFKIFLNHLRFFKKISILNLSNNSIGSINGHLKEFSLWLSYAPELNYVNLENNLIGAFPEDLKNFQNSLKKFNNVVFNLQYNPILKTY